MVESVIKTRHELVPIRSASTVAAKSKDHNHGGVGFLQSAAISKSNDIIFFASFSDPAVVLAVSPGTLLTRPT